MLKVLIYSVCFSICLLSVTCGPVKEETCEWLGIKGKCVPARVCLTSLDTRGDKAPACPSRGAEATICCTDCELVNDTSNFIISPSSGMFWKDGRKGRDACLQYLKDLPHICHQDGYYAGLSRDLNEEKKCHIFTIWGIGGAPALGAPIPSENPYEALIGFGETIETATWKTAGAIISEKFILTSASGHATTSGDQPVKFAALGVKNRKDDKKEWQIFKVKKIYHPEQKNNDIALLELEDPIIFDENVLPACLPEPGKDFDISNAKFSSWKDKTSHVDSFLDTATILSVPELTAEECDEKVNADTQLCYGTKDTCLNILGAPVVVTTQYSRCMNTVIGVNVFGDKCGPSVFTKVVQYVPWIESIVWP